MGAGRVRTCLIGVLHCCNLTEAEVMKSMWPFESSSFSNSCGNIGNTSKEDMKHVRHCYIRSIKRKKSKKNKKGKKSFQSRGKGGERLAILVAHHK